MEKNEIIEEEKRPHFFRTLFFIIVLLVVLLIIYGKFLGNSGLILKQYEVKATFFVIIIAVILC